jgi:hypothetical protein
MGTNQTCKENVAFLLLACSAQSILLIHSDFPQCQVNSTPPATQVLNSQTLARPIQPAIPAPVAEHGRGKKMDASHPQGEAAAGWVTVEEWSGSSASALSRTAVLTASASSLTSHRWRPLPPSAPFRSSDPVASRLTWPRACAACFGDRRFGSRWGRIGGRMLGAFVPEVNERPHKPRFVSSNCIC